MVSIKKQLPDNWKLCDSAEQLAQQLAQAILTLADKAIMNHGAFHFITAGGTTPNRCYEILSQAQADWDKWHIYLGDERVLPFVNAERNSQALLEHWLNNNDIPAKQVHFINTEAGMKKSAQAYANLIEGVESFDLCLLGMGEDGHTASLFPQHENFDSVIAYGEKQLVISESCSPKPPSERVSLNYSAFEKCAMLFKVISGASKRDAVAQVLEGRSTLPIAKAKGVETFYWLSKEAL